MDENKLLESIGDLIDEKVKPIRDDIKQLSQRMDSLENNQRTLNQRFVVFENGTKKHLI